MSSILAGNALLTDYRKLGSTTLFLMSSLPMLAYLVWTYFIFLPGAEDQGQEIYGTSHPWYFVWVPYWSCYITSINAVDVFVYGTYGLARMLWLGCVKGRNTTDFKSSNAHLNWWFSFVVFPGSVFVGLYFWSMYVLAGPDSMIDPEFAEQVSMLMTHTVHTFPVLLAIVQVIAIDHGLQNWTLKELLAPIFCTLTAFNIWLVMLKFINGRFPYGIIDSFWDSPYHYQMVVNYLGSLFSWFILVNTERLICWCVHPVTVNGQHRSVTDLESSDSSELKDSGDLQTPTSRKYLLSEGETSQKTALTSTSALE